MPKRKQTKTAKIQALLTRPTGASIAAICKATGWQAHSARAALSGLRKAGYQIERSPAENGKNSIYRITAAPEAAG